MSDDYAIPSSRKSKRDKKAKRLHRVYKKGGFMREKSEKVQQ